MFSKIMLAVDLSYDTEKLLDAFYSMCPGLEKEVYLLHVVKKTKDVETGSAYYKRNNSRLRSLAKNIQNAGYDNVTVVWEKAPGVVEGILESAEKYDVDLVLMLSHGKGVLQTTLMGSHTYKAVRKLNVPVLIVKMEESSDCLKKVLLPTDFSRRSLAGLDFLRNMREYIGEVIFLNVMQSTRDDGEQRTRKDIAEDLMSELVGEMQDFGISARYIIAQGKVAGEICRVAEEEECTLIFASKSEEGFVRGMIMGDTAQSITLYANCSLLFLPEVDDGAGEEIPASE